MSDEDFPWRLERKPEHDRIIRGDGSQVALVLYGASVGEVDHSEAELIVKAVNEFWRKLKEEKK